MKQIYFSGGSLILPDRIVAEGALLVERGKIVAAGRAAQITCPAGAERVEAGGGFIGPGYVDLHVHGGAGADFMDVTVEAWQMVLRAHARHGTTSCTPTTTVAPFAQILAALDLAVAGVAERGFALWNGVPGVRILGAHFYGPYFAPGAQGCHPGAAL
ncbi:MAG: N-acetylglucosamine-6-phosphate deacetylase, partial [Candidatus Latescibacterota bacterium]|nr:N-acetylglucosamine-6-phosphate deacetylase [Candidatus Latescibacterota bacterium]